MRCDGRICSSIHWILSSLALIWESMHCLSKIAHFLHHMQHFLFYFCIQTIQCQCMILFCDCFSFLKRIDIFFSQENRYTFCHVYPKKYCLRPLYLIVASLVTLGGFYMVPTSEVTALWTQACNDWSMSHPVLQSAIKTHLDYKKYCQIVLWIFDTFLFFIFCYELQRPFCTKHFLIKCSCKIILLHSVDICTRSAISFTFTLQSSK